MPPAPSARILFVDDDANVLAALQRNLRKLFVLDTATSAAIALQKLRTEGPYAVIVADMSMPVMNGVELLELVRKISPDTVRLMLTGNADQQSATDAVNRGRVHHFLTKPCPQETLVPALEEALRHHRAIVAEKTLLDQTLNGALQVLTDVLAVLDPEAFGHAQLCRAAVRETAHQLGLGSTWDLEIAAQLADLGRVTLPPTLREKVRARQVLTESERQLVARIPEFSAKLLGSIPRLGPVAEAVLYQNKNFDGSGFPADDRRGDDIPLGGRVLRAVRSLLAMHRGGMPVDDAITAIASGPEHYDPAVARALVACAPIFRSKPVAVAVGVRCLPLAELAPGYLLISDIVTVDGVMVLGAGATLESVHLQRLRNFASLNPIVEPITVEIPRSFGGHPESPSG